VTALRDAQLEPAAAALRAGRGGLALGVRFEGFGPGVAAQLERLAAIAGRLGLAAEVLDAPAEAVFWGEDAALRAEGAVRARLAAAPSALAAVLREVAEPLARALDGAAVLDPVLGVGVVGGTPAAPAAAVRALGEAREALSRRGGSLVLAAAPAEVRAGFDPWGPPPASLALMRSLKAQLDPEGRLAPGRFVGGI
jgi:glycolate oxidase FAD binding subunit